jgi:hypothetical protein
VENDKSFIRNVLIASLVFFLLASYPIFKYLSQVQIYSIACGYFVSLLNALIGYKLNRMALKSPVKSFMALVFGGMGIRILISAILLVIFLVIAKLDEISLIGSAFFFYIVFVTLEIYYFHTSQLKAKDKGSSSVE